VKGADLKPRAVAVLVALRHEARNRVQIRNAIGDPSTMETIDLLGDLSRMAMVGQVPGDDRWYLDHSGVGWLETNGLGVNQDSRLWVAQERKLTSPRGASERASVTAARLFDLLGSKAKRALAHRDSHAMREHTNNLSHECSAIILAECDKYAADWKHKNRAES
jgi:hypothetical protein